jgi:U3 small nucleolar RNA-associated protein 14
MFSFRKRVKRENEKQEQLQEEIEQLDPEAAAKKLVEQEKEFIRERATMRHKNSSKWVRNALKKKDVDLSVKRKISLNFF